jgi:type I restriction enzyme, S subunit
MSFPRYKKTKPSGVEWLGDVPEHWEVCALKRIVSLQSGESITSEGIEDTGDYPVYGGNGLRGYTSEFTHDGHFVLVGRQGALCGNINYGRGQFWASEHALVASPIKPVDTVWLGEMMRTMNLNQYSVSAAQPGLSVDLIARLGTVIPPLAEQTQIAAFLDRETAKIDALVAEQRRLMELLKEKRQAVISHAVTQGLNPKAPMKPSGIEWLGDVPQHWEVKKLSHLFRAGKGKNGQMLTKEFCGANEGDYPVYSGQTENEGVMGTWDQFDFDFGDAGVLFSTTVGAKAMHLRQLFGRFSLSQNCMIIWTVSEECVTRFFYYHFQPLFQYQRAMIPEHMQASFRMEDLYGYYIALPPRDEQLAIINHLDAESTKFDTLTAEAQRAIDLLQERRTALISAAVTGQIDVRS